MATLKETFKNVFTYAAGIENWVKQSYPHEIEYTFAGDFAIADWFGVNEVNDTFNRVIKEWGQDYKSFTEIVVVLNQLSWANHQLKNQGVSGRDKFIDLYADLYEKARDMFYDKFGTDEEASTYFYRMTD